jgi:hypothetical protein
MAEIGHTGKEIDGSRPLPCIRIGTDAWNTCFTLALKVRHFWPSNTYQVLVAQDARSWYQPDAHTCSAKMRNFCAASPCV